MGNKNWEKLVDFIENGGLDNIITSVCCGECHHDCDDARGTEEECPGHDVTVTVADLICKETLPFMKNLAAEWIKGSVANP